MSLPVCPQCGSAAITWQHPRVPSGSNGCTACGFIAPVREFHADKPLIPVKGAASAPAPDPIVSPIPVRKRRKPHHEVKVSQPIVTADFWYLRD